MIKRTIYFGNPAYLSLRDKQMVIKIPSVEQNATLPESFKRESIATKSIEDLGVVVVDHRQVTITSGLLDALLQNNCAVVTCDSRSMPSGLLLPLSGNTLQQERFEAQIAASLPLKKQLWQQTIKAKISNQAAALQQCVGAETRNMQKWSNDVRSGDPDNLEARAAAYYWKNLFPSIPKFVRGREEEPPNNLLNYGYAILRAVIARSLVASGILPTLGIHHHNRYNAYCLADDIMEPYRPYVDKLVVGIIEHTPDYEQLTTAIKAQLLTIPTIEVVINGQRSPLMIAAGHTAASLYRCYIGENRRIAYPEYI